MMLEECSLIHVLFGNHTALSIVIDALSFNSYPGGGIYIRFIRIYLNSRGTHRSRLLRSFGLNGEELNLLFYS